MAERAHGAADSEGSRSRVPGPRSGGASRQGARGGGSGGATGADGMANDEHSTSCADGMVRLSAGGDEQRHPCEGEVRDREEPPLSKKSRNEQKRKKLEKRKRVEEDSRPRETVKTNKRGCSPSATQRSLQIRSPVATLVRSPGINLLMSPLGALARAAALKQGMRSPSLSTPCCTVHVPSPTRSPPPARTSFGSKRKPRKLTSIIWKEVEPIYRDGKLVEGRCTHCHQTFPASESAFSTRGRVISDYRSRLSSDTVEALICLQDWLRADTSSHQKNTTEDLDDADD